ncbi:MAG: hypothetical protein PHD43_15645 [Methylococcales bacterium]|nr:hypothetical protein [Methylococcales bacterium]
MTEFKVTFDWGARSETLRSLHAPLKATKSFLLTTAPLPVGVGIIPIGQAALWDTVDTVTVPLMAIANTYTAQATIPDSAALIRLDFKLQLTIGTATATCLEFRQFFSVGTGGALMPTQYSFAEIEYKNSPSGPVHGPSAAKRRILLGTCPLVSVRATKVEINCEFLDVTDLWWANWANKDQWGWYLDPDFGGRPELLRVLAWTSGTAPMIWFVAISPKAMDGKPSSPPTPRRQLVLQSRPRPGADVVFFRPQPGFNSFFYTNDAKGFLAQKHSDTTMYHLARWMLPPLSLSQMLAKQKKMGSDPKPLEMKLMSLRLVPNKPSPNIEPKDPIDLVAQNVRWAFRPVGVEGALSRSPAEDIALLPLGFDGFDGPFASGGGYTALMKNNALRDVLASVRRLLWMRSALGRTLPTTPTFERELWLLGHSAGNRAMFQTLNNNAADIDCIISNDATSNDGSLFPSGVRAMTGAANKGRKTLRAFFITTPNMWHSKPEYEDIKTKLAATKAAVTMLPLDSEWDTYWTYPPTITTNPLLFEVLRAWENDGLSTSKRMGTVAEGRQWLFWHEWAVDGGQLVQSSATGSGQGYVRTFFEDALRS